MKRNRFFAYSIIIMVVVIVFALIIIKKNDIIFSEEKAKRLNLSSQVTPISNSSVILCNNGMLVEGEGINIKARGIDGKNLWSLKLENKIKDILQCGTDILIITQNNNIAILNNSGKRLWQYEMPITPTSILTDGDKYFIIQYNWREYNTFEIYSTKGVKSCTGIIDKAHILSFSSSSGKFFTLSLLDTSSDKVLSKVVTYNTKGEILWANNYDSVLVPKIKYGAKDNIAVAGENFIKKYNSKGKLLKEITLKDNISNLALSESLIIAIVKSNGYYEIHSYDTNLNQLGTAAIKNKPDGIFATKDEYLLYSKDSLTIANKYGKITALYESNYDINDAYIHNDNSIYIISNRRLLKLLR